MTTDTEEIRKAKRTIQELEAFDLTCKQMQMHVKKMMSVLREDILGEADIGTGEILVVTPELEEEFAKAEKNRIQRIEEDFRAGNP